MRIKKPNAAKFDVAMLFFLFTVLGWYLLANAGDILTKSQFIVLAILNLVGSIGWLVDMIRLYPEVKKEFTEEE